MLRRVQLASRLLTPRATTLALLLGPLSACGLGSVIAKPLTIDQIDDQQGTCKVAKDPLSPLIVEWPGISKVSLDSVSKRGIVVVSYASCALKVLSGCSASGRYEYTAVTPARDKIQIESQDDLYARLPLGAVSLKGELARGNNLELDYIAVGQRVASEVPVKLTGDCEGATHYVRTITIGAYNLDAAARARAEAGVDVGNAGVGASRKEGDRRLHGSGDVERCASQSSGTEEAAQSAGCGAPLQLDLAPLQRHDRTVAVEPSERKPAPVVAPEHKPAPVAVSAPQHAPSPPPTQRAPHDADGDGIADDVDLCPTEPEDKDGFQDADGCPDPDNDGDGIPDVRDKCPNVPENFNGYEDEDGCPDRPPGLG